MSKRDNGISELNMLSKQNKSQLKSRGVEFLELRNNKNSKGDFITIKRLDITFRAINANR